jgi:hypothetical protein
MDVIISLDLSIALIFGLENKSFCAIIVDRDKTDITAIKNKPLQEIFFTILPVSQKTMSGAARQYLIWGKHGNQGRYSIP